MRGAAFRLVRIAVAVLLCALPLAAQAPPTLRVPRLQRGGLVTIDGVLGEEVWQRAGRLGPLTQVEPVEGAAPVQPTEALLCYDDDYLYLALVCRDDPRLVRSRLMARDAVLDPDDRVEWWIDTFHDQRFAFWFQIGAGGSRGDALIAGNGDRFNKSWDGIWYGKARVTDDGWQAEVALPFKTLAFKEGSETWGFNLRRLRKANDEEDRWAAPLVSYSFFRLARGGTLTGLTGMQHGLGLDVVPYGKVAAARDARVDEHPEWDGDAGGEIYYRLSPELRLTLSVNTDFAETEVDERQVNLTRFPLFFPEKRDFFLEDAGLFEFGVPSRDGSTPIAFFSRRVGLSDGKEVPILLGGKLAGRLDSWNVGALGTVLDAHGEDDERALGVLRLSRNLGPESYVGLIGTGGRPDGPGGSYTGGVDFKYGDSDALGPGHSFSLWSYWLGTRGDHGAGDGASWGGRAELRSKEWSHSAAAIATSREFDPELGFVRRTGQREYSASSSYTWRSEDNGLLRRVSPSLSAVYRTFTGGETESWGVELEWVDIELDSGERAGIESRREFERLPEDFEIHEGVVVPAGDYATTRHRVEASSSDRRIVAVGGSFDFGDFYSGRLTQWGAGIELRPSEILQLSVDYSEYRVRLVEGSFTTRLTEGRLDVSLSPDLSLRNLVQYDTDTKELGLQSRLRWTIEPGSDLYLLGVYGWGKAEHDAPLVPTTQSTSLKLVYTFRF